MNVKKEIEKIVFLENKIGFILQQREFALKDNQSMQIDGKTVTARDYISQFTRKMVNYEEERNNIIDSILLNVTLEELYNTAKEFQYNYKMEELLIIFELIERKERDRERGR